MTSKVPLDDRQMNAGQKNPCRQQKQADCRNRCSLPRLLPEGNHRLFFAAHFLLVIIEASNNLCLLAQERYNLAAPSISVLEDRVLSNRLR